MVWSGKIFGTPCQEYITANIVFPRQAPRMRLELYRHVDTDSNPIHAWRMMRTNVVGSYHSAWRGIKSELNGNS
jgi:hypothetical protein